MRRLLSLALILWLLPHGLSSAANIELTLIHVNDLHGHILPDRRSGEGGMAALATLIQRERQRDPDVIFLDAGDLIQGSAADTLSRGELTFRLYDQLKPDAYVLGNHAFDYGLERLFENLTHVGFPVLCANYRFSPLQRNRIRRFTILERKGIRIGVLGLTIPRRIQGLGPASDPIRTAQEWAPRLRGRADILIALTHIGLDSDLRLAREVPDLDLIVGGHSHTLLQPGRREGRTLVVQAGAYGAYAGKVLITYDTKKKRLVSMKESILKLDARFPPDPELTAQVNDFYQKTGLGLDEPVAWIPWERSRTSLAEITAQAAWERFQPDLAVLLVHGFRKPLPSGTLYRDDLYRIFPFDDVFWKCSVEGPMLRALWALAHLEKTVSGEPLYVLHPTMAELEPSLVETRMSFVGTDYMIRHMERTTGRVFEKSSLNVTLRSLLEEAVSSRFPLPREQENWAACRPTRRIFPAEPDRNSRWNIPAALTPLSGFQRLDLKIFDGRAYTFRLDAFPDFENPHRGSFQYGTEAEVIQGPLAGRKVIPVRRFEIVDMDAGRPLH